MDSSSQASPTYTMFVQMAKEKGVFINGVVPTKIPLRGLGLVTDRPLRNGEDIVKVPTSCLLTTDSIPQSFKDVNKDLTVHGLLAAFISSGVNVNEPFHAAWRKTWPLTLDFQRSMPLLWPADLLLKGSSLDFRNAESSLWPPALRGWRSRHPRASNGSGLLAAQERRLKRAWGNVSKLSLDASYDDYVYAWLIVNTRSFYYDLPLRLEPRTRDDRIVLCPFVDFFNHSNNGCRVAFDALGFTVTSDRDYEVGEEVFVSYGCHSNDFLLTEYGFMLDENMWDSLPLDDLILPIMDHYSRRVLNDASYLGCYCMDSNGVCHRTQVAVRSQTLSYRDWRKFVEGDELIMAECPNEEKADSIILEKLLLPYHSAAKQALALIDMIQTPPNDHPPLALPTLRRRWMQIKSMVEGLLKDETKLAKRI